MVDLTGKIWKLYNEKINTAEIRAGDMVEGKSQKMGVVYRTKCMIRVAFPHEKEAIEDIWFVNPHVGKLRMGSSGYLTKEDTHYELAREFLDEAEALPSESR